MEIGSPGLGPELDRQRHQAADELAAARAGAQQAAEELRNFSMLSSLTAAGDPAELDRLRQAVSRAAERCQAAEVDCLRLGLDPELLPDEAEPTGPTSLAA